MEKFRFFGLRVFSLRVFVGLVFMVMGGVMASAQNITNVDFYHSGEEFVITYDLDKSTNINVCVSTDGGRSFGQPLKMVSGAVGSGVRAGRGLVIRWRAMEEVGEIVSDRVQVMVCVGGGADYIDEYGINHGSGVKIAGVVWAPVNCGYHEDDYPYGKLYQWGRKYGQGWWTWGTDEGDATYPSGSNLVSGPVSNSTGNSSSNKDKFYVNRSEPYDWCNPQLSDWSSEYDPCPAGWRVPTESELRKLQANYSSWTTYDGQNGYWFSGDKSYSSSGDAKVFFPAAGYRNNYGNADDRGSSGFYRSSSVSGSNAYRLYFRDGNVGMYDYYLRANGYSVRCVKDL